MNLKIQKSANKSENTGMIISIPVLEKYHKNLQNIGNKKTLEIYENSAEYINILENCIIHLED